VANAAKLKLFRRFVQPGDTIVEFGPGDCCFAYELCKIASSVLGVDISDQSGPQTAPDNFELLVYDGYRLDVDPGMAQVVISDQLIEHFHPEDTEHHFRIVRDLLQPGGRYVFRTPHRHNGPHDVSKYFTQEPQGFHLKEWTYGELADLLSGLGYESCWGYVCLKSWAIPVPATVLRWIEQTSKFLPNFMKRIVSRYILRDIFMSSRKCR
jgi:SAM-dependent methyltransferase